MSREDASFKRRVLDIVSQIPTGRVMTYGQIAAYCDAPWAAWEVGQIAHFGPQDLPWQRVVNKQGGLARSFTGGGIELHKKLLEQEGIVVSPEFYIDVATYLWQPK